MEGLSVWQGHPLEATRACMCKDIDSRWEHVSGQVSASLERSPGWQTGACSRLTFTHSGNSSQAPGRWHGRPGVTPNVGNF